MSIKPTASTLRRAERANGPDLVDRMVALLIREVPDLEARAEELSQALRDEFAGIETYIRRSPRAAITREVMKLFDGRNAAEVARQLQISRATVYRVLRQPGD